MLLRSFEYVEPKSVQDAIALLSQHGDEARPMAGGTDLLVQMKHRIRNPRFVVSLKSIPSLDYISLEGDSLCIGAGASLRSIESSPLVQECFPMLASAVRTIGSVQIRHLGTLVGNLCHASPSADSAPALLCLGARVKIVGRSGEKLTDLEDFFVGPGQTVLGSAELVEEVQIPLPSSRGAGTYAKHSPRRGMDLAQVGVAVHLVMNERALSSVRIALGAVAPTPMRARRAESILEGNAPSDDLLAETARAAAQEARPISDIRCSAEYRRKMVEVQTSRAIRQTLQMLGEPAGR